MGKNNLKIKKRKKGASGIPNWLLVSIVTVVIVAVLLTCAATLVSSSGTVLRMSMAMKSDDYTVNGNMMTYYYVNTYNTFLNNYGDYITSFSLGGNVPITEHRNIQFGGTAEKPNSYDSMFLGSFKGTWFDYFMAQTKDGVKSMLMYCEEADERNLRLTKEELDEIDTAVDALIIQFRIQNGVVDYSDSTVLNAMYGKGVKKSDIRKAMELSTLATKCQEQIYKEIDKAANDNKIAELYSKNAQKYNLVDYFTYTFDLNYDDVAKEILGSGYTEAQLAEKKTVVDAAYKAKMDAIKNKTEELSKLTSLEAFKKLVYTYVIEKEYTAAYEAQKIAADKAPDAEALKTIKAKLIEAVVAEALSDADSVKDDSTKSGETYTLYGITVKSEFATAAKKIKNELFTKAKAIDKTSLVNRANFEENNEFSKWAFDDARKAGDIKTIIEGAKDKDFKKADKYMSKVYFLIKPEYKDEANSRDVAYMMFQKQDDAKKAIEKIAALSKLDKAAFEKVATEAKAATNSVYEDYIKGAMQSDSFDEWLYDDATKIGSYTKNPLTMSDGSFMVAYYVADGEICWKVNVRNDFINDSYAHYEDLMTVTHSAKVGESPWTLARIAK